ncbi:MAG: hypothetical protein A3J27_09400 [Candidatus Tectomicrobia bacterium RIFCSPLOWO2_12_FULL_69_37]|nr:MAG: hypothetical protein A3I72_05945 [Candidatus Tectomicrobia bacterium RIFCSPLOWO2_02_FULL_70_19]OGL58897.1 MAG: hypothetical protein A3J27_09400 [Candidatus Tectomicrobia bacterium RIFCSPLOWO2_12_FULL_69_37]
MRNEGISPEPIPETHALGRMLRRTTESAFEAVGYADGEVIDYVWRMLLRFVHVDSLYRRGRRTAGRLEQAADFLAEAEGMGGAPLRELKLQMGDVCLFFTGLFPENLERRRLSPAFYVMQGKAAYGQVAEMDAVRPTARFFRKLTHEFEQCVVALHVERQFLHDSVYQYVGRQFPV